MTNPLVPLGEALDVVRRLWADDVDVAELSGDDLALVTTQLALVQRHVDAAKTRVAHEVARKSRPDLGPEGLAKKRGFRSPVTFIATTTGVSTGEAARLLEVGEATAPRSGFDGETRPARFPVVAEALAAGRIGVAAAGAIVRLLTKVALAADPDALRRAESELVEKARMLSLNDLTRVLARAEAWLDPVGVAQRESELRSQRALHIREGKDGMLHISAILDPEHGAVFKTAIEAIVTSRLRMQRERAGRGRGGDAAGAAGAPASAAGAPAGAAGAPAGSAGDLGKNSKGDGTAGEATGDGTAGAASGDGTSGDDTAGAASGNATSGDDTAGAASGNATSGDALPRPSIPQMQADALIHLIEHTMGCGETDLPLQGATVIVRMTLADLQSDEGFATVDGLSTPVSAQTARRMAAGGAVIPCVLGADSEIVDWGRERRLFTRAQKLALVERDGGCAMCGAPPGWTKAHHIRWWTRDAGPTDLANGVLLCESCHHRIHDNGWDIRVDGARRDSAVWFIPPADVDPARTPRLGGRALYDFAA
ncbi:DUF222 domain-containing protein [Microbacterium thalassium]|uniref:DUF222 domain-containing protein n=1 Tax=Microbacterium thalassium TaxID=362649 RepID=UPI0031E13FD4